MKQISILLILMGMSAFAHAAVLAEYTFTTNLSATSVLPNVSASAVTLNGQSVDPNGGTVDDNTYQFTAGGLNINRGGSNWNDYNNGKFTFTIGATGANSVTVH